MINKKLFIGAAVLTLALTAGIVSVSAYQGDYSKQGPAYSPERHTAMKKAFANNSYKEWQELMSGRGRVTQVINEENFAKFAEAHRLAHEGDLESADAIRKELGLRTSNGEKVKAGYGKGQDKVKGERQDGQWGGKMNSENRGQNKGGKFIDADNNGICDNL